MKKIISLCLLGFLAFSACKKDTVSPVSENTLVSVDDFQSQVSSGSNARKGASDAHLQIAIRKVENKANTYRLVLKMDSLFITEKGETKLIALPAGSTITAGLSIPNTEDPKASIVIFEKNKLNFKKQNEKGFTVFVSDPFTTDVNFEYELVRVETSTNLGTRFGDFVEVERGYDFIFVPSLKAISQNPEVVKIKTQGKWTHVAYTHASGKPDEPAIIGEIEFAKTVMITIANDPAQTIKTFYYLPDLIKVATGDPKQPIKYIALPPVVFTRMDFNPNTGVARFISSDFEATYGNGTAPKEYTGQGTLYRTGQHPLPELMEGGSDGPDFAYRMCCKGAVVAFKDPIMKFNHTALKGSATR